jgi:hypothetical protein
MSDELKDKVALVSDAGSSGPGWSNGKGDGGAFSPARGAKVLVADINLDAALETKQIIEAEGGVCEAVAGNVGAVCKIVMSVLTPIEIQTIAGRFGSAS